MRYYDTSVMFAAISPTHARHRESLKAMTRIDKRSGACSLHSLAELYSLLTRIPQPFRLPPKEALRVVESVQSRLTIVSLTTPEYLAVIRTAAERGLTSGAIHDSIHVQSAIKVHATQILTLNLRDFLRYDPSLTAIIAEP